MFDIIIIMLAVLFHTDTKYFFSCTHQRHCKKTARSEARHKTYSKTDRIKQEANKAKQANVMILLPRHCMSYIC